MIRRPVGNTGLEVTAIGLGTASLASAAAEREAVQIIQVALENGIRFLDTAPHYGPFQAEVRLGLALAGIPRDTYVLETKVGRLYTQDGTWRYDFSYDGILRSLEGSLQRLKLDYVDSILLHDPFDAYQQVIDTAFPAMDELRRQGVVKSIGVGIKDWQLLMRLADATDFDCFMQAGHYSLLEQEALPALARFQARGIAVFAAKIFQSGILATGVTANARYNYREPSAEILAQVHQLQDTCDRYQVPLCATAIQFVAAHPAVTSVVVGVDSTAQLLDTLNKAKFDIPLDLWRDLRANNLIATNAPLPGDI